MGWERWVVDVGGQGVKGWCCGMFRIGSVEHDEKASN